MVTNNIRVIIIDIIDTMIAVCLSPDYVDYVLQLN